MLYDDVFIEAVVAVLPERVVPTSEIEEQIRPLYSRLGVKPGWVESVTGIRERRVWRPEEIPTHRAAEAGLQALNAAGIDPYEVRVVVSTSVAKDRLEPSLASTVHARMGLGAHCLNLDVGNACLGFLSGMQLVANQIQLGQADVGVVVAAEDSRAVVQATIDRLVAADATFATFRDNLATLTLGSAAVAMVLTSRRRTRVGHRLLGGAMLAATEHNELCMGDIRGMVTDSNRLLNEGVRLAERTWDAMVHLLGWSVPGISAFAAHQVGAAHHTKILETLRIPEHKSLPVYGFLGNIGAAGVPTTLALTLERGRIRDGDQVALLGIGSGLNCAMMGVRW
jgi:3-oxoacyl-[acyl-carrier-protein] synthase III